MSKLLVTVLMFFLFFKGMSQSQEKIYATLILNVARGIQWPDGIAEKEMVIGVVDYPPLEDELKNALSVVKMNKRVQVKHIADVREIINCNILFVPAFKARSFPKFVSESSTSPLLLITNKTNLANQGSGVNFVMVEGKVKYEINCKSIEARGLRVSAAIKGMGIQVN